MKRCIVLSVRTSVDKKTSENLLWISVGVLPSKTSKGSLFYPKTTDIVLTACFGELRHPDSYSDNKNLTIGSLVDITYGFNEFTQKPFISKVEEVCQSPYTEDDLFV